MGKNKKKLTVQIATVVLIVNIIGSLIQSLTLNSQAEIILQKSMEEKLKYRFVQIEQHFSALENEIKIALTDMQVSSNLRSFSASVETKHSRKVSSAIRVLKEFDNIQYQLPYCIGICYYGMDGKVLKSMTQPFGMRVYLEDGRNADPFFASSVFLHFASFPHKVKWHDSKMIRDFGLCLSRENNEMDYMSVACPYNYGAGIIVLNLDMDYFMNTLDVSGDSLSEGLCIVDECGRILASRDSCRIGDTIQLRNGSMSDLGIVTYHVADASHADIRILTYGMNAMDWTLVCEIPISEMRKDIMTLRGMVFLTAALINFAVAGITLWWMRKKLRPLQQLDKAIMNMSIGQIWCRIEGPLPKNELGMIEQHFNRMSIRLEEMFQENIRIENEKNIQEMRALRAQINPHLIYNVLGNIRWNAMLRNEYSIAEGISLLADFLVPIFSDQGSMCTLKDELDYVGKYIEIINLLRMGKFSLVLDLEEGVLECLISRFLLQPLVENALQHGYANRQEGAVWISAKEQDGRMTIVIGDEGQGIPPEKLLSIQRQLSDGAAENASGVGMANVSKRLKSLYGSNAGIAVDSDESAGTSVTVWYPVSGQNSSS